MVNRVEDLEMLRSRLVASLDVIDPKELPRLSREIRAVNLELSQLAPAEEADQVDELRAKRAARIAAAEG